MPGFNTTQSHTALVVVLHTTQYSAGRDYLSTIHQWWQLYSWLTMQLNNPTLDRLSYTRSTILRYYWSSTPQSYNITPCTVLSFTIAALLAANRQYYYPQNTLLPPSIYTTTATDTRALPAIVHNYGPLTALSKTILWYPLLSYTQLSNTLFHQLSYIHSHNNPIMPPPLAFCHQHKYNRNRNNPIIMLPPTNIARCWTNSRKPWWKHLPIVESTDADICTILQVKIKSVRAFQTN